MSESKNSVRYEPHISTPEEIDAIIDLIRQVDGENSELIDSLLWQKENYNGLLKQRREQFARFSELAPGRCGTMDHETGDVTYNTDRYSVWHSNYDLRHLEQYLYIYDFIGLDYELRAADLAFYHDSYAPFIPDDEDSEFKYWLAGDIHTGFCAYYRKWLKEHGLETDVIGLPYIGCEAELFPDGVPDGIDCFLTMDDFKAFVSEHFDEIYKKNKAPKPVFELRFENVDGRKKCYADLDRESCDECKKHGFSIRNIQIPASAFREPKSVTEEEGRPIYHFEFFMEGN